MASPAALPWPFLSLRTKEAKEPQGAAQQQGGEEEGDREGEGEGGRGEERMGV